VDGDGHDAALNDYPQGLALDSFDNLVIVGDQRPDDVTAEGVVLKYDVDGGFLWSDVFTPGDIDDGETYSEGIEILRGDDRQIFYEGTTVNAATLTVALLPTNVPANAVGMVVELRWHPS